MKGRNISKIIEPSSQGPVDKILKINVSWAFSPIVIFLSIPLPIYVVSALQPADTFLRLGQPNFLTQYYILLAGATLFVCGFIFLFNFSYRTRTVQLKFSRIHVLKLQKTVAILTLIVFSSYAIWVIAGISRGLSFAILLDALNGNNGAIWRLKSETLAPISGVTTWVALGTFLGPLAIILWRVSGKSQTWLLSILGLTTALRATFFSERLAFVELAISCLFAYVSTAGKVPFSFRNVKNYLVSLFFTACVYVAFFASTELIRSWVYYSSRTQLTILQFSFERIIAYYSTALNNGALYIRTNGLNWSPFDLLQGNFELGGVKDPLAFLGGTGIDKFSTALTYRSNPEFNNVSGVMITNSSLGILGSWAVWGIIALLAIKIFRMASEGSLTALLAYPIFAVGILEMVRLFYFGQSRIIPNAIALVLISSYLGRIPRSEPKDISL